MVIVHGFVCIRCWDLTIVSVDPTGKTENGTETKRDRIMPDLCVICLEQEYNAVFIQ